MPTTRSRRCSARDRGRSSFSSRCQALRPCWRESVAAACSVVLQPATPAGGSRPATPAGGLRAGTAAGGIAAGRVSVVGVEPVGAPTLTRALQAGRPVDAETGSIAIDSLAPRRVGEKTFGVIRDLVRQVVLVSDDAIRHAQDLLWETLRLVGEPGGCAALAAVLSGQYSPAPDEIVTIVISGANTTAVDFGC